MRFSTLGVIFAIVLVILLVWLLVSQPRLIYTFVGWIYVAAILYFLAGIFGWLTPVLDSTFTVLIIALLLVVLFETVLSGFSGAGWNWWNIIIAILALLFLIAILWSYSHILAVPPSIWFLVIFTAAFIIFSWLTTNGSILGGALGQYRTYYWIFIIAVMVIALLLFYAAAKFIPRGAIVQT